MAAPPARVGVRREWWRWVAAGVLVMLIVVGSGLLLSGGTPGTPTPEGAKATGVAVIATPQPTATFTPQPTPTPTPRPTLTPGPTPEPVLAGTPVPQPVAAILPDTADRVVQLARWGKGRISEITYSPDGRLLAVASSLGIYLYDAGTLEEVRFIEMDAWVTSVAFSPDGEVLVSGSCGERNDRGWCVKGEIKLWRVSDGKLLRTLKGHTDSVLSVAFSPDGEVLASGSWDDTVRLWRVSDGKLLRTLEGHTGSVRSVAFSPDGEVLASGSKDNTVRLWRVSDGKLLRTLEGHTGSVRSVAFSPDGEVLASGSYDGTVRLWGVRP